MRLSKYGFAIVVLLILAAVTPSFASDSILFVNGVNHGAKPYAEVKANITVDGNKVGGDEGCTAESDLLVICTAAIVPGTHSVVVQLAGAASMKMSVNVEVKDAATNWPEVPKDVRLWCISVGKSKAALMSKDECWKIEDAR